ncbi:ATP-dependent helicase HrpB [Pseudoxanthomonas daejeonensis]|uniref:ATP-dependent helicase HrpB n=1 Tax=Pseudoxanthomonas daejeonensis TaxID=266062 RepID=A0ABQ6ZC35_9GAMM|nr:ATP-dependent helicase HrpB [Pseudoxanthomonas daejeonensis]KAF1697593.1 ATP-dependent helicase HrpB [Pseudoxanthomonas daejeonensis]
MESTTFPIAPLLPAIADSLAAHPRLVLEAPPGAGKTTQVPLALLDAPWLEGRRIVMLEPRRVAARSAAMFMARQLGEDVGDTVGYRIRFENRIGPRTRIEVVTEGILTRMIQDDPELGGSGSGGVGLLLFDEFHERHLAADLGLALALDVQAQLREDLRIVVMSATLDGERLARFLDAPRLSSAGRSHPVQVAHFPARREESVEAQARRATEQALAQHPGDVLVFLPGQREIARVQAALEAASLPLGTEVLALHGELPVEQQSRVLQPAPDGRRRVVLATNVAESSVTLPGVRVVVDAGLAREPRFDPNSGFSRLDSVAISQASADQRAGRAGRVADGWAWRLWPESQRLEAQRRPEIAQVELAGLALELAAWGSDALRFVDPPPAGALAAARELLQRLGALSDAGGITAIGQRMLALGTHPRLAAMLLAARNPREQALAADLAALVEARDPLRSRSDALAERWRALAAFRQGSLPHDASRAALASIDAAARQWRRRLRCEASAPAEVEAHELGDLLAHAFPDRIAARHPLDPLRYALANGRTAKLFDDSALRGEPWLVASELRFEQRGDALLLRAAPVDESRLRRDFPERFVEQEGAVWDADKRALVARRESRFDRIVLDSRPAGRVDPAQAAQALTDAVRELGLAALPWTENLRQWQARMVSLRAWLPDLALPDMSDAALQATLDTWLRPAFAGKTRLDALSEDELGEALKSPLDWSLRQQLDRLAPVRITVPSGMERRIDYALDHEGAPQPPVLAVKLQELFGLADTPRIADGRVPLLLHLLSPGGKPLQVTGDLKGFWDRTYPEVRKEMKGRYPRHPWPDDPWSATATHRAKPRGT